MTQISKLPYWCKEIINLYALNTITDYENLKEFNKICDYEPCIYSHIKLRKAEKNYIKIKAKQEARQIKFVNNKLAHHSIYHRSLIGETIWNLEKTYKKLTKTYLCISPTNILPIIMQLLPINDIYKKLMNAKRLGNYFKKLENKEKWVRFMDTYFMNNDLIVDSLDS